MKRFLLTSIPLLLGLAVLWADKPSDAQLVALGLAPVGGVAAAPRFVVKDLDGKTLDSSDLKGKVILLNFWATWCPPCRAEMPTMERMAESLKDKSDFILLAVDMQESSARVRDYVRSKNYRFPVVLDSDGSLERLYAVSAAPTTFLVGYDGSIWARAVGMRDWSSPAMLEGFQRILDP